MTAAGIEPATFRVVAQHLSINVEQILEISPKLWFHLLCLYVPVT